MADQKTPGPQHTDIPEKQLRTMRETAAHIYDNTPEDMLKWVLESHFVRFYKQGFRDGYKTGRYDAS